MSFCPIVLTIGITSRAYAAPMLEYIYELNVLSLYIRIWYFDDLPVMYIMESY